MQVCPVCSESFNPASAQEHLASLHAGRKGVEEWVCGECDFDGTFNQLAAHCLQRDHDAGLLALTRPVQTDLFPRLLRQVQLKMRSEQHDERQTREDRTAGFLRSLDACSSPDATSTIGLNKLGQDQDLTLASPSQSFSVSSFASHMTETKPEDLEGAIESETQSFSKPAEAAHAESTITDARLEQDEPEAEESNRDELEASIEFQDSLETSQDSAVSDDGEQDGRYGGYDRNAITDIEFQESLETRQDSAALRKAPKQQIQKKQTPKRRATEEVGTAFQCPRCPRSFAKRQRLLEHSSKVFLDEGELRFSQRASHPTTRKHTAHSGSPVEAI